jgi:hypothetical protein
LIKTKEDAMDPTATAEFHREALRHILSFLVVKGIRRVDQLNALKAKKLLKEPLWKLLELNGKMAATRSVKG